MSTSHVDQLSLVERDSRRRGDRPARPSWKLDERTRAIGLAGVAEGRRILREAAARKASAQGRGEAASKGRSAA